MSNKKEGVLSQVREEKRALKGEKSQYEAKLKEKKEASIKQMIKNLVIKEKSVPIFYDDKHMKAKVFNVRVFVRKKRFKVDTSSKLQRHKYSPFKVTQKINENAYIWYLTRVP
jgi:DNA-binding helix-hairpin-helix protein with protein kinase domain